MTRLFVWISRVLGTVSGRAGDRRLADEIEAHLALLAEEFESRGMSPAEGRRYGPAGRLVVAGSAGG